MKVVYVAGPIRAPNLWLREQNIRKAEAAALGVWLAGGVAICVHAQGRFWDETMAPFETWIRGDLELIKRCDALLMVEGWERSQGALMEHAEADRLGLPVFYDLGAVAEWVKAVPA